MDIQKKLMEIQIDNFHDLWISKKIDEYSNVIHGYPKRSMDIQLDIFAGHLEFS